MSDKLISSLHRVSHGTQLTRQYQLLCARREPTHARFFSDNLHVNSDSDETVAQSHETSYIRVCVCVLSPKNVNMFDRFIKHLSWMREERCFFSLSLFRITWSAILATIDTRTCGPSARVTEGYIDEEEKETIQSASEVCKIKLCLSHIVQRAVYLEVAFTERAREREREMVWNLNFVPLTLRWTVCQE